MKRGTEWILDAEDKANCFGNAFEAKHVTIDAEVNEYSEIPYGHSTFFCGMPTIEATENALKTFDEDSALGPDMIPTRILKQYAHALAPVLHKLIIAILTFGEWPMLWTIHWVVPLFKRKSMFDPGNYKSIHLTSQISKVAERVIAFLFVPQLISTGAFGRN